MVRKDIKGMDDWCASMAVFELDVFHATVDIVPLAVVMRKTPSLNCDLELQHMFYILMMIDVRIERAAASYFTIALGIEPVGSPGQELFPSGSFTPLADRRNLGKRSFFEDAL